VKGQTDKQRSERTDVQTKGERTDRKTKKQIGKLRDKWTDKE
jgi:hypothetical protein